MLWWLLGVAVAVLIWSRLWKTNFLFASGILVGLPIAWLASLFVKPYVTGMESIPLWLPPLPLATIAIVLFVYGGLVWFRGEEGLKKPESDDTDQH